MSKPNKLNLLPGDYIFREGEFGHTAYIIESGSVELIKFTGDQHTVLAELDVKGSLFGEMAIIENSPRSAAARAKTECVLTVITEEELKKHLSSSPNASLDMMRRLASYARSANERLSRDAFSEVSDENDAQKPSPSVSQNVDSVTKKTLREFNDDLDEFSKISPKKPLIIAGMSVIAMVISFGVWASMAEIDVTVSSRGKILTSIPNVEAQSNHSSVIKTILVREGDEVEKGQPIALFDETLVASDFRNSKEELTAIEKEITSIQAELNFMTGRGFTPPKDPLQLSIFNGQIREIERLRRQAAVKSKLLDYLQDRKTPPLTDPSALASFNSKIAEIKTSLTDMDIKISFLKTETKRLNRLLVANVVPSSDYENKAQELSQIQSQRNKYLAAEISANFEQVEELLSKLGSLEHEKNKTLQGLLQKRQGLSEKFIKLSRQAEDVELRSPVSGTILKLEDQYQGTVIKTGDTIATIVPKINKFHVEVDIDPADITHVYEGAKVKIMLDALPSQKHGELVGKISLLSKDTVDEDVFGEKNSVYRAEVEITENKLVKLPEGFRLLPSMSVAGNIISGKRTIMTFLLFPVIKTLETSFREP
ncbi:HlyD family type I secretion periplasmic adaptor subunit [Alphaproteobacteria bacterium]|nr:HlyD family type I secretion periplasmic adaptor subunit [Alphaproteobacteria bacterium]